MWAIARTHAMTTSLARFLTCLYHRKAASSAVRNTLFSAN